MASAINQRKGWKTDISNAYPRGHSLVYSENPRVPWLGHSIGGIRLKCGGGFCHRLSNAPHGLSLGTAHKAARFFFVQDLKQTVEWFWNAEKTAHIAMWFCLFNFLYYPEIFGSVPFRWNVSHYHKMYTISCVARDGWVFFEPEFVCRY